MSLFWIAVALVFAIAEVVTVGLFSGFAALGALGAAVAAFLGANLLEQAIVFAVVAVGGIVLLRRPLLAYLQRRHSPALVSGAPGMIGQLALVVDPIQGPLHRGHVRIAGEDWPALTTDGQTVEVGTPVRVVGIQRATLVVEPAPDTADS